MRDMGTESELSSALLSANGVLCAAIGQGTNRGKRGQQLQPREDGTAKGPEPIAKRNQKSRCTVDLLTKISRCSG